MRHQQKNGGRAKGTCAGGATGEGYVFLRKEHQRAWNPPLNEKRGGTPLGGSDLKDRPFLAIQRRTVP